MAANVILPQSGDLRATAIQKETAVGTPAAGAWETLRNTGGAGVVGDFSTTESAELTGSNTLGLRDLFRVGEKGQADYNFQLSYATAGSAPFEYFMESILQNTFSSNTLTPGTTELTLSIEDTFSDLGHSLSAQGAQVTSFSVNIQSGEVITGSASLVAPIFNFTDFEAHSGGATDTVAVTGGNTIDPSVSRTLPSGAVVGSTVLITASDDAADIGLYKVTAIDADAVTVDGTLVNSAGKSMTIYYAGATQQTTTANAASTNEPFIAGNSVSVELSFDGGSTWIDSFLRGFRFPSADFTVSVDVAELREVTLTEAYATSPTARTIDINLNYHLVDIAPIRYLNDDTEVGIRITVIDSEGTSAATGNKYVFTFPRCKTVSANAGDASKGSEMTGTWTLKALLNSSDIDMQVDRTVAS